MGTSHSFDACAVKLSALGTSLSAATWLTNVHRDIGKAAKADAARLGGTMHPWSKGKAAKRSVRLTAWDKATAQSVQVRPRQPGLWAIREDGAKAHTEPKRRTRSGRLRKQGKVLTIPGSPAGYAASAGHPGAAGQRRWTAVHAEVEREAPGIVDKAVRKTLTQAFGPGG